MEQIYISILVAGSNKVGKPRRNRKSTTPHNLPRPSPALQRVKKIRYNVGSFLVDLKSDVALARSR